MQKFRSLIVASGVLVVALSFGVSASALAHGSSAHDDNTTAHSEGNTSSNATSDDSGHQETENHSSVKVDVFPARSVDDSKRAELHSRGTELVKELEKNHKTPKTDAQRKKVCENRKAGLNGKINTLRSNSLAIQDRIDNIYAKAQAYQQKNNLQPNGYADLIAAADIAKAQAAASVTALQAVSPTITCDGSTSTLNDVATYKAAAQEARDNLKTYRNAVKSVLKSLEITKKASSGGTN